MRSRKPEAKAFSRWVRHEVLPQIRKTGGYIPVDQEMSDVEILARAMELEELDSQYAYDFNVGEIGMFSE